MVNEKIFATVVGGDKAVAFFVIEPFHDTGFCLHFLHSLKAD
jgi:hypothetical protein